MANDQTLLYSIRVDKIVIIKILSWERVREKMFQFLYFEIVVAIDYVGTRAKRVEKEAMYSRQLESI